MVKQYGELYLDARRALLATEDPMDAGHMARILLSHVSGKTQEAVLADRDLYASGEVVEKMQQAVKRLLAGEPLPYVLGEWEFYGLPLIVSPDVLIPRDDTCAVAEPGHQAGAVSGGISQDSGSVLRLRLYWIGGGQPGQGRQGDAGRHEHESSGSGQEKLHPE